MEIKDLINQGYEVKSKYSKSSVYGYEDYISGEEYESWIMLCIRFLHHNYPKEKLTSEFENIGVSNDRELINSFERMIGILKAFHEIPTIAKTKDIDYIFDCIFNNFHKSARALQNRHGDNRTTIEFNDEYDVQDYLNGILKLFFDDVRPEDYVPSYAGSNSRTDFFIPEHETFIETKMTRGSLKDKQIGEELTIDVARYRSKCKTLICFVYDKSSFLTNPYGLIKDLEKLSTDDLKVKIYISPL